MSSKINKVSKFLLEFLPLIFLILIYVHNLSRSVYGGDVGDLVAASTVMGVPHAPGYPLFILLGFLLTRINLLTPAFMVGLISVFSSALGVFIFFKFSELVTKNRLMALLSSLTLAFNYLFWFYSEIAEVFALNTFFLILIIYLSYKFYKFKKLKDFYLLSFFIGLSLTNHQTIIFVLPLVGLITIPPLLTIKAYKKIKVLFYSIFLAVLGFSVYIYVPIASYKNPPINWDMVKDIPSFLHLLLRKDYGTFSSGSSGIDLAQRIVVTKIYLFQILVQLTIPVVFLSLLGFFRSFFRERKLSIGLLITFLLSGPLFIAYAGFPLISGFYLGIYERFFVMSAVVLLFYFPFGISYLVGFLNKILKRKDFENLFVAVFFIIPLTFFIYNFPKTNLHRVFIGDYLGYDVLSSLPKNSVVFLGGDTLLFNAWYVHYALGYRPDLKLININGVGGDPYFIKAKKDYLAKNPKDEKNPALNALVMREISETRPVFSYDDIQPLNTKKFIWIPEGLLFKMLNTKNDIPTKDNYSKLIDNIWSNFYYLKSKNDNNLALGSYSLADIPPIYAQGLLATGNFYQTQYSDNYRALYFYTKAEEISPDYSRASLILGAYYYDQKDCKKADEYYKKSISLFPFDKNAYYLMYANDTLCLKDSKKALITVQNYSDIFKSDFFKDIKKNIETEKK